MPKNYVKVRFNPQNDTGYLTDLGLETSFNTGFYLPSGIPDAEKSTILNNIGATPLGSIDDDAPCPQSNQATPRKLKFTGFNGVTTEIPINAKTNLLNAATVIRGIFQSNGLQIACIELIGEEFPNLNDQLNLNYANTFAKSHINIAPGKQSYYHGSVAYQTDANSAIVSTTSTVFHNIKSITDVVNSPSTQLNPVWTQCVGDLVNAMPCRGMGRRNPRKHRRFELTFATKLDTTNDTEPFETEMAQLPVIHSSAADILACGQAAAALPGAFCIAYSGESYKDYHLILP